MSADPESAVVKFKSSSPCYDANITAKNGDKGMLEQTAIVVSVESGHAWVVPQQRGSGCGGCGSTTACVSSSTFDFLQKEPQKMRVLNPLYARPGDKVVVAVQGEALVVYSLLAYLLPLVGLIVAAIIGREVFALMGLAAELGAVLGGVAGLVGGLRLANLLCDRSFSSSAFQPVILRVVGPQPVYVGAMPAA